MAKELLKMEGITKIYGNGFMANKDITFTVNEGEIHALIGENGAGKTTLMKILFGLENCQQGKIYLNGEEAHIENPLDAIAKGVGMVHQHFMLVPNLSVAENVVLGIEPGPGQIFDKKTAIRMTEEASEKFQLKVDPNALVRDISVGLKQKVELLKALIRGAKVLILDEPTAVLTPQEVRELFVQLKSLKENGYGIIFISHKLDEVMELCDSATVLRHGRVTGFVKKEEMNELSLSRLIVGRDIVNTIEKDESNVGDTVLKIRNITYVDDIGKTLVDDVSFGVRAGEIVGIAGVEGNGQNEISEIITGLLTATKGTVSINGTETTGLNIAQIRKLGLAHISEDRMTYGCAQDMSIYDNLSSIYLDSPKFTKGVFINQKVLDQYVKDCIEEFEIACDSEKSPVRMLSGGNIQKVIVAREFTSGANIIIANQPTRGIDVGTASLIHRLLQKYTREKGFAVLLISSDLNEVMNLSDRLLIMRDGKVAAQFTDMKMVNDELMGEYMLGIRKMSEEERGELY
ncbi:MAG TPA: ABC transporter ATP-binding protein [Candidatus Lachnoclostridium pullistercoris]|uniref:ABC transporter ATP-binding protein n=1 Tax=Candidatus Lachnoclostridium pullistercoris TaxID=2838632 RepID=A0A9D2T6L1_9FIRM|nr:ABC transporter ATP-binding protein [Candidatus Lachnoclostridium pullistercoris]